MSDQQTYFNARIRRINDPRNNSYLDPETGIRIPKQLSRKIIKTNNTYMEQKAGFGAMLLSLILGAICVMGALYVRFTVAGIPNTGTEASTLLAMDAGLAAVLVFVLGGILKHKSFRHMMAQVVGIAFMLVTMHNLVWFFPDEFAQVYTQDFVTQVTQATEPLSIHVNGATVIAL